MKSANHSKSAGRPIQLILLFFAVILIARVADSLLLRTNESMIGELFTHKLFGIALMGWVLHCLHIKWRDIGFNGGSGNGTATALVEMEHWCRHVGATAQERIGITRFNRAPILETIRDAGARLARGEYFKGF